MRTPEKEKERKREREKDHNIFHKKNSQKVLEQINKY